MKFKITSTERATLGDAAEQLASGYLRLIALYPEEFVELVENELYVRAIRRRAEEGVK